MSSYQKDKEGLEPAVTRQIADFLFKDSKKDETGESLDMRTAIDNKDMFAVIVYYRVLGSYFKCTIAHEVANILERLSLSMNRESRHEAVISLLQKTVGPKYLPSGMDELAAKLERELSGESAGNKQTL